MFGIDLHEQLRQPWEQARGFLIEELDQLKAELRGRWNAALGPNNTLNVLSIGGDGTPATRSVTNTGPNNAPTWDRVNLSNGVKNRLPFANMVQLTASVLLGRGSASSGDIQELTLGSDVQMTSVTFDVSDRVAAATSQQLWSSEGGI